MSHFLENAPKEYLEHIRNIAINIEKIGIPLTHEPPSIAAGCILLIVEFHKLDITKKQISSIFGLSDVTISKTYRKLISLITSIWQ